MGWNWLWRTVRGIRDDAIAQVPGGTEVFDYARNRWFNKTPPEPEFEPGNSPGRSLAVVTPTSTLLSPIVIGGLIWLAIESQKTGKWLYDRTSKTFRRRRKKRFRRKRR